jgi:hypothetical protein
LLVKELEIEKTKITFIISVLKVSALVFSLISGFLCYFFRELQAIENGETDPVIGQNALDKERCLLNDDPKWLDTTYVLANYKTEPCKKPPRLCRQGYAYPQFHNKKDKWCSPKKFKTIECSIKFLIATTTMFISNLKVLHWLRQKRLSEALGTTLQ